jgi:hypothetical protein
MARGELSDGPRPIQLRMTRWYVSTRLFVLNEESWLTRVSSVHTVPPRGSVVERMVDVQLSL